MEKIRIQKMIADSGYCSRRAAEELITKGIVKVNGHDVKLGDKATPGEDIVTINGKRIEADITLRYIKLYKPRGYMTSMSDAHGKKMVTELLTKIPERVYPVGRLDKNSEGILILTNDGEFANLIMHPTHHVNKIYRVTIAGKVTEDQVTALMTGVKIDESIVTMPCVVNVLREEAERTVLEFIIKEGKNRQIRKMCEAVKLDVSRLKRTSIGGVKLGMLKPGEYVDLTKEELKALRNAVAD